MSFTSYTLIAAYFLSALGFASVSLVDGIEPWFVAMTAFAAVWSLYFNVKKKTLISSGLWNVLAVMVFVLFLADFLLISRTLIVSASRFLTVLLALKLFDLKTGRDHFIAFGIVFFQILAAAASTVSPAFFVILALFIAASIFVLMIFTMKKDWEAGRKAGAQGDVPRGIFDAGFFAWIAVVTVFSLAGALALFFILPRMGAGFFERKTLNTVKVTGFSDRVNLDSIGPVKNDGTIVMRVELPPLEGVHPPEGVQQKRQAQGGFYFRGAALDFYDGKIWSRELRGNRILARTVIGPVSHFSLEGAEPPQGGHPLGAATGETVEQNILLEPLETDILFAASHPVEIAGKFSYLSFDDGRAVYLPSTPYSRVEYKVWSVPGPLAAPRPEDEKYTDTSYLTNEAARARIAALTAEVIRGQVTDFDKAIAIEKFLRKNFAYTLNPKKEAGIDPVDAFLFFSKEGYCAHFASSMAVMLRLSGVPSRIVTGFLQGEWNSLGGYFIVRQMDAHSWVEAYARQNGVGAWHTFDPTPSAGTEPPPRPPEFMLYLDFIRWKWNRYIINFTFSDQRKLAQTLESRTAGLTAWLKNALREKPKISAEGAPLVLAALLLAAACYLYMKKALGKGTLKQKTPRFYLDLLGILEKKGYVKKAFETPMEFAARVEPFQRVAIHRVTDITELFQKERYGGAAINKAEAEKVKRMLEGLKKGLPPAP